MATPHTDYETLRSSILFRFRELKGGAGSGNFGHGGRPGERGGSSSEGGSVATPSASELASQFKDLPRGWLGGSLFRSDTAIELTSQYRTTEQRRQEYARLAAASSRDSALRAMDSEKDWGTGWTNATDEWQAAQALGASSSVSKATKEAMSEEKVKPLSDDDVKAFKERLDITHEHMLKENPEGTITVYRGIKGAQAKKAQGQIDDNNELELGVHGLSSWSTYPSTAAGFAGKKGVIVAMDVPIKDVWSAGSRVLGSQIVRFTDQHGEVVVKTSDPSRRVRVTRR
jgi:hypothetical protein